VPARAFEAGDGRYVQVAATSDAMYAAFCRIIDAPELVEDPRFRTNALRVQHREEIMPILEERMRRKTADQWLELFEPAGIPCGPVMDMAEVFSDPNIAARDLRFEMPHPVEGSVPQLGFPFRMEKTPATARRRPPLLGEHNGEVVMEWLGMTAEEVSALQAEGTL
jgi:crotonobetainyl-CoA:carnitine CoA-transferase CaiB-like acyl-CoA transferase